MIDFFHSLISSTCVDMQVWIPIQVLNYNLCHTLTDIPGETTFRQPVHGQSLINYLSSQDFNTCANLDKVCILLTTIYCIFLKIALIHWKYISCYILKCITILFNKDQNWNPKTSSMMVYMYVCTYWMFFIQ